ncbi:hypothetical protein M9H77_24684 [Catharanthus roseus]|uniref:Uncharacterized protein n=1 Tax=Catharanthus roseus TaxID=4058 RepID=A0ACC0A8R8_CATRO|nr:hypothetical protein M9H77_24684 [Catharanthus roseus]
MAEEKRGAAAQIPPQYDLNAKWDACLDLGVRRFVYSSFTGAFAGLLLFRSPVTRWASVAFGAGIGIGSAYTECSQKFDVSPAKLTPSVSDAAVSKVRRSGFFYLLMISILQEIYLTKVGNGEIGTGKTVHPLRVWTILYSRVFLRKWDNFIFFCFCFGVETLVSPFAQMSHGKAGLAVLCDISLVGHPPISVSVENSISVDGSGLLLPYSSWLFEFVFTC